MALSRDGTCFEPADLAKPTCGTWQKNDLYGELEGYVIIDVQNISKYKVQYYCCSASVG